MPCDFLYRLALLCGHILHPLFYGLLSELAHDGSGNNETGDYDRGAQNSGHDPVGSAVLVRYCFKCFARGVEDAQQTPDDANLLLSVDGSVISIGPAPFMREITFAGLFFYNVQNSLIMRYAAEEGLPKAL